MTNLLAIMFIIAISLILLVVSIILKNTIMAIVAGLGWAVSAMFMFQLYATGDPDYSYQVYGFGWICALLSMSAFFSTWWLHRRKTEQIATPKENFYNEDDPDFRDMQEIYQARQNRANMRRGKR